MIPLEIFFANPFSGLEYGIGRLLAFTTDHLGKLRSANLSGVWPERIAATEAALEAFNGRERSHGTSVGERKTSKAAWRKFRRALPERLGKLELLLQVKYGRRAAALKTFFPDGKTAFARCADDVLGPSLKALAAAVSARAAELGPEAVSLAAGMVSDWEPLYAASEASAGTKAAAEVERRGARAASQRELYLNLQALALEFPEQPEKLRLFMQQSFLTQRRRKSAAG